MLGKAGRLKSLTYAILCSCGNSNRYALSSSLRCVRFVYDSHRLMAHEGLLLCRWALTLARTGWYLKIR